MGPSRKKIVNTTPPLETHRVSDNAVFAFIYAGGFKEGFKWPKNGNKKGGEFLHPLFVN